MLSKAIQGVPEKIENRCVCVCVCARVASVRVGGGGVVLHLNDQRNFTTI